MTPEGQTGRLRRRLIVAGVLAAAAIALSMADHLLGAGANTVVNDFAAAYSESTGINAAVDDVLARYKIPPNAVTTWRVLTPDKKLLRLEQRIVVPHEFPSVECNSTLSERILPFGARVAATERSREDVVTMHIVSHGVIIRTISFVMRPREDNDRVEQTKTTKK
jgi:hypothetical protein